MAVKSAFVTGATGFLGLNLVSSLVARGWHVTALHRSTSNLTYLSRLPTTRVEGDIADRASLDRVIPTELDAIFHVAGNVSMWAGDKACQTRDNVEGTRNVLDVAMAKRARRFVHTSTISVYGLQRGKIAEDAPKLGETSWLNYQRSKFLAEQEVRSAVERGLDAVILNPANVIGAYDTTSWARLITLVHSGRLAGVPPGAGSFCHARAVAEAHIAAAERGTVGDNYLLGGADASYLDMVRIVAQLAGRRPPRRAVPAWALRTYARLCGGLSIVTGGEPDLTPESGAIVSDSLFCDSSKAEKELEYRTVGLWEMIEESYRWLESEGLLEPA